MRNKTTTTADALRALSSLLCVGSFALSRRDRALAAACAGASLALAAVDLLLRLEGRDGDADERTDAERAEALHAHERARLRGRARLGGENRQHRDHGRLRERQQPGGQINLEREVAINAAELGGALLALDLQLH